MDVNNQVIEVLDHIGSKFGVAIDWSQENVLPYLQELTTKYIYWEVKTSKMWLTFGIILVLLSIVLFVLAYFAQKYDWSLDCDMMTGFCVAFGICFIITSVPIILVQTFDLITCNHFPEKLIIDYLRSFVMA